MQKPAVLVVKFCLERSLLVLRIDGASVVNGCFHGCNQRFHRKKQKTWCFNITSNMSISSLTSKLKKLFDSEYENVLLVVLHPVFYCTHGVDYVYLFCFQ